MMFFRLALQHLLAARRRNALLALAIALVTGLLVFLLSIGQGIEDNLVRAATTLTTGHFNVFGFYKINQSESAPILADASQVRAAVEELTPDLERVIARHRGWGKVISDGGSIQAGIEGLDLATEPELLERVQLAAEREYRDGGSEEVRGDLRGLENPHAVALFAWQARRLGVTVGDRVTLQTETSSGRTNTLDATVVAVARDMGLLSNWVVMLPSADVRELYSLGENTTGSLHIYLHDIDDAPEAMQTLRTRLESRGFILMEYDPKPFWMKFETVNGEDWLGQKLDMSLWRDEVLFLTYALTIFDGLTWFLVLVLGAVIGVGIMNAMWNTVRDRTREIGMMRAIGMQRRQVLALILTEALLLGLFATGLGAAGGAALAAALNAAALPVPNPAMVTFLLSDTLAFSVEPGAVALGVLLLTALTATAAAWPAHRASRLPPITAIQTVE